MDDTVKRKTKHFISKLVDNSTQVNLYPLTVSTALSTLKTVEHLAY